MAPPPPSSRLDRPAARVAALGLFGLCVAALAYIHRDDIRPGAGEEEVGAALAGGADPAARCIAGRYAEIDGMVEEGVVGPEQARLFKSRAEALCRAQQDAGAGSGLGGGPPPGARPPEPPGPRPPAGGAPPPPPGAVRPPGG